MLKNSTSARFCQTACYAQPGIELYKCDNLSLMPFLTDESIDVICIDPPYLYLKNQKLERAFDELKFFTECKRLLTKDGFIIMFGRGTSFYRWNTLLADLGFVFKEEIVWDKKYTSAPTLPISRVHETVSIHTLKNGTLNKVTIPYLESKTDLQGIQSDIKRLKVVLKNFKELESVEKYLDGFINYEKLTKKRGTGITVQTALNQKSRCVSVVQSIKDGMRIKSIIPAIREHYCMIHPTQKPVGLIEKILRTVIPATGNIVVADFFAGSMSTMEACYNLGLKGIAVEIDEEYFEAGKKRIENLPPRQTTMFE